MRTRNIKLNIFLNENEKEMLDIKAKKVKYNYSQLIRSLIKDFHPKESPPEEFYIALEGLRKIGNVINQIARYLNQFGYIRDFDILMSSIERLNDMITDIRKFYLLPEKKKTTYSNF